MLTDAQITARFSGQPMQPDYHRIDTLGRTLAYTRIGHDTLPLLLFIHGAPGSWYGYLNLLQDTTLQQTFQMISVDRPGYGKSDYGYPLPALEDQGKMLHAILERYQDRRPIIVVGRSYGSPIAARLAMDYPELVDAFVMLAPAIDPDLEKFWWFSPLGKLDGIKNALPDALNVATVEKYAHRRELRKMLPLWEQVQTPNTVIQGGDDDLVLPANLLFAEEKLKNAPSRIVFVPNQNHFISSERPDLVKKYVMQHYTEYFQPAQSDKITHGGHNSAILEP